METKYNKLITIKKITDKQYNELLSFANDIETIYDKNIRYNDAVRLYNDANYYYTLQQNYIIDDDFDAVIKNIHCLNEDTKDIVNYEIKAKKQLTKLQWLKLLLGSEYFYMTIQKLREYIK